MESYAQNGASDPSVVMCPPTRSFDGSFNYDWGCLLRSSMMFYDAQRSGKVSLTNTMPWRSDSSMKDVSPLGSSLVGGFYDAGGAYPRL